MLCIWDMVGGLGGVFLEGEGLLDRRDGGLEVRDVDCISERDVWISVVLLRVVGRQLEQQQQAVDVGAH